MTLQDFWFDFAMCFQIYLADLIRAVDEVFNIDPSEVLCSALFFWI